MTHTTGGAVQLDQGRIAYEIAGDGEVLVLAHAGCVDRRMWDDQWHDLAQRYRVIRYDMRGYGESDPLFAPMIRHDELHQLLEHLGVVRAILIGCSLGGEAVLDVALEHPECVAALVLVSTVPSGFALQGEPPRDLLELFAALGQGEYERASELQCRIWVDGPFREAGQVNPHVRARVAAIGQRAVANRTLLQADPTSANRFNPPATQRLGEVSAPTLIIAGALDHPELLRAADVLASNIPQARKAILPNCAHLPNMEWPAEFNRVVLEFLEQRVSLSSNAER